MHGAVNVEDRKVVMYVSFPGCSSVWICEWCLVYMETHVYHAWEMSTVLQLSTFIC